MFYANKNTREFLLFQTQTNMIGDRTYWQMFAYMFEIELRFLQVVPTFILKMLHNSFIIEKITHPFNNLIIAL